MKLTKLLSIILVALIISSCSKDDDGSDAYNFNKDNLTGTYTVNYFQSKEVKTQDVNGFNVTTTTTSTGDTFDVTSNFDSNDVRTINGTYRVKEVKTQGDQTGETAYIVVLNNEKKSYSVNASTSELTIGNKTFKVTGFSRTGFKINMTKSTTENNGDTTVYTEEWGFKK